MKINKRRIALLAIDFQKGFLDWEYWGGNRNNPALEEKAKRVLAVCRKEKIFIFHIKHCSQEEMSPLRADREGNDFFDWIQPKKGEVILEKHVNSAFIGTSLEEDLRRAEVEILIIIGLTSNHCISTTARMAGNLGFTNYVISDATATFDRKGANGRHFKSDLVHAVSLSSLDGEFCKVINTKELIKLLQNAND